MRLALVGLGLLLAFASLPARADTLDRKLILRSRTEAMDLWRQGWTLGDTALDARLQGIVDRLTADRARDTSIVLRVHVFRSPVVNAFCLPDGSIYVFAGLLACANDWDEVAFVLAHEAEHALGWHGQKNLAQAKKKSTIFGIVSMAIGSNSLAAVIGQLGLELTQTAMITGYGRDLEAQADAASIAALQKQGVSPCEGVGMLRGMLGDQAKESGVSNFFWGSHPMLRQRIATIGALGPGGSCPDSVPPPGGGAYAAVRDSMARFSAKLWLDDDRLPEAQRQTLRCLERDSSNAEMHAVLGEVWLRTAGRRARATRKGEPDTTGSADTLALAERELRRSLEGDPASRGPWRSLGLIAEARRDTAAAIACLERYLGTGDAVPNRRATRRKLDELRGGRPTPAPSTPADSTGAPAGAPRSPQR